MSGLGAPREFIGAALQSRVVSAGDQARECGVSQDYIAARDVGLADRIYAGGASVAPIDAEAHVATFEAELAAACEALQVPGNGNGNGGMSLTTTLLLLGGAVVVTYLVVRR